MDVQNGWVEKMGQVALREVEGDPVDEGCGTELFYLIDGWRSEIVGKWSQEGE